MSGVLSCKQCGCSEIDTDPARGDAVCTSCGFVLEESIIVSEVTFEEDGHGGASAVGQFVSAESRGGGGISGVGGNGFHTAIAKESRELTLRNAKKRIVEVAQQLRLNQHCIDVAFNFFKMALHKQLTKGRKNSLTIAACIYMTCRIEGTPHLLIDFSDVLQMDVYALGRAYVQISRSLYINIPAVDPCMYILRFAHKFELGERTHEVAMTALRLVQRMKRDWIHLGRRPSGLCGAALLIAARLHNFSRSVQDVIRVVKVHETTLRKRLVEFGETPSSSLTLDEFMSVDLEEEHDPPSYKAARIKDRERLQRLLDADVSEEFKSLQVRIDEELDKRRRRLLSKSGGASPSPSIASCRSESGSPVKETDDAKRFIMESTLSTINCIIAGSTSSSNPVIADPTSTPVKDMDRILMPPPATTNPSTSTDIKTQLHIVNSASESEDTEGSDNDELALCEEAGGELDLDGIDDDEINGYIMSTTEVQRKTHMWEKLNQDYILAQKVKQEQLEKDLKEGKLDKKKKKNAKAKPTFQAKSANEAIKIMLKERKMSSKINYDVLRSLTAAVDLTDDPPISQTLDLDPITIIESGPIIKPGNKRKIDELDNPVATQPAKKSKSSKSRRFSVSEPETETVDEGQDEKLTEAKELILAAPEPAEDMEAQESEHEEAEEDVEDDTVIESGPVPVKSETDAEAEEIDQHDEDEDEDLDEDEEEEEEENEASLSARRLLTQFRGEEDNDDEDYYE